MQWSFLRASLMTLAVFTTFCESKANDVVPTDTATANEDGAARKSAAPNSSAAEESGATDKSAVGDDAARGRPASDTLCAAVASAAQDNGLPLSFFSNLIWQESRFIL